MQHRRTPKKATMQKKLVERWPERKIAEQRYKEFAEPALKTLRVQARKLTRNPALAEEMIEEAVIKIIANSGEWKPEKASKKNFAIQIGARGMLEILKSEKVRQKISLEDVDENYFSSLRRRQADPFEKAASVKEIAARVKQFLNETIISQIDKFGQCLGFHIN